TCRAHPPRGIVDSAAGAQRMTPERAVQRRYQGKRIVRAFVPRRGLTVERDVLALELGAAAVRLDRIAFADRRGARWTLSYPIQFRSCVRTLSLPRSNPARTSCRPWRRTIGGAERQAGGVYRCGGIQPGPKG